MDVFVPLMPTSGSALVLRNGRPVPSGTGESHKEATMLGSIADHTARFIDVAVCGSKSQVFAIDTHHRLWSSVHVSRSDRTTARLAGHLSCVLVAAPEWPCAHEPATQHSVAADAHALVPLSPLHTASTR